MSKRVYTIALLFAALFWTSAFEPFDDWFKFTSPEGTYSVLMPAQPAKQVETKDTSAGKIVTEI